MRLREDRLHQMYSSNIGEKIILLEYRSVLDCDIMFEDGTIVEHVGYRSIKESTIKNLNKPSVCGVGYLGYGPYIASVAGKNNANYACWKRMIERCYDGKYNIHPTYKDVTVCKEWHNFQNFASWYEVNYVQGWDLDKDILSENNKIYSSQTCVFVPVVINSLFTKEKVVSKYLRGVSKIKKVKPFRAQIRIGKTRVYLGTFNTKEEANIAYQQANLAKFYNVLSQYGDLLDPRVKDKLIQKIDMYKKNINGVTEDF